MKNWIGVFVVGMLLLPGSGIAQNASKTKTIDIPTDLPPPSTAEEVVPTHPFFGEPVGNELMNKIEELDQRVAKLEEQVRSLEEGRK